MSAADNPFTAAYDAIFTALHGNTFYKSLVRTQKETNLNDLKATALRRQITDADSPLVWLLQGPFLIKSFGSNSKIAEVSKVYNLVTVTNSIQVDKLNQVEFAVCAALFWGNLEGATFKNNPFIRNWTCTAGSDGFTGLSLATNTADTIDRMSGICSINVEMYLARTALPT